MVITTCKSFEFFDGKETKRIPDSWATYKTLLEKVRETFDVKRYEEGGLMEEEVLKLLNDFINFVEHNTYESSDR